MANDSKQVTGASALLTEGGKVMKPPTAADIMKLARALKEDADAWNESAKNAEQVKTEQLLRQAAAMLEYLSTYWL